MTGRHDDFDPDAVAAWLRRHPRFLTDYPDLALMLPTPRAEGAATSLASYQLEVLRDKNRALNKRLLALSANAADNERLATRVHHLSLSLMRAGDEAATWRALVASLIEDFTGDDVRIMVFERPRQDRGDLPTAMLDAAYDPELMALFADLLTAGEPVTGRLQPARVEALFGEDAARIESLAVLPVGKHALVAIGSRDPQRFFPGMGTLFLGMISQALLTALARFDRA